MALFVNSHDTRFIILTVISNWGLGSIDVDVSEIDSLSKVRNLVCHAATIDLLVEEHSHVRRLADAKSLSFKLFETHGSGLPNHATGADGV